MDLKIDWLRRFEVKLMLALLQNTIQINTYMALLNNMNRLAAPYSARTLLKERDCENRTIKINTVHVCRLVVECWYVQLKNEFWDGLSLIDCGRLFHFFLTGDRESLEPLVFRGL